MCVGHRGHDLLGRAGLALALLDGLLHGQQHPTEFAGEFALTPSARARIETLAPESVDNDNPYAVTG